MICRGIEVAATIHVPRVVNSQADQLANKAMDTRESKKWPCVYVNSLALAIFFRGWVLSEKRAKALPPAVPPQAARMEGGAQVPGRVSALLGSPYDL